MKPGSEFKPAWWLPTPHLQTIWPALFRKKMPLSLTRERVELDDGDFIDLAWHDKAYKPLVLILHGLEGSIASHYSTPLMSALDKAGFASVFMHFRNCSHEPNRLPRSYHSGDTGDIEAIVRHIKEHHNRSVFAAIGFSLGGNALLKWLGETGNSNPLTCASAISVPFILSDSAEKLDFGFSRLYQYHLLRLLRKSYKNKFSSLPSPLAVKVEKLRTFREFDNEITAPLHGFRDVDHYYGESSCRQYLKNISIPTCLIHSQDDPFMFPESAPGKAELSEQIVFNLAANGGHVGFVSGSSPFNTRYWYEEVVCEFLQSQYPSS